MRSDANALREINEYFLDASAIPTAPARPGRSLEELTQGTNRATPIELIKFLDELQELTDAIELADRERWITKRCVNDWKGPNPIPCHEDFAMRYDSHDPDLVDDTTRRLREWQARLDFYFDQANEAQAYDREAVLTTVTAPLLLGWHYREDLPPDVLESGYGDLADNAAWWELQHVPDAATALGLANAVNVDHTFQRDNLFTKGLVAAAKDYAADAGRVLDEFVIQPIKNAADGATKTAIGAVVLLSVAAVAVMVLRK